MSKRSFLFFYGSHHDVFSLGAINNTFSVKHNQFIMIRVATCFDHTGSSSGLHYEPVNYKAMKLCTFLWSQTMFGITRIYAGLQLYNQTLYYPTNAQYITCRLLTYSIVQSPSWEANWFAANQEIPRISRNPKVHHRTQKRPPTVSILGQPNPGHIPTSHLLEIHPNITHSSTPRSPHWFLSLRFPHQDPIHHPILAHTRHMPSPSHSSLFYHPHNIGWIVQII